jgi:hypothetical protein
VTKLFLIVEARTQLILSVIVSNLALGWLVCRPVKFAAFKLICLVCIVIFDLLIGYILGKVSATS